MDKDSFLFRVRQAKKSQEYANIHNISVSKVSLNSFLIIKEQTCKTCQHKTSKRLEVVFNKKDSLTIFETSLLFMLFVENKKPVDYAEFHKRQAGKEFIENINNVQVIQ